MNFRFWKKKPLAEEHGGDATDETIAADEAGQEPVKPGWFARLKGALRPSHNKSEPDDNEEEPETLVEHVAEESPPDEMMSLGEKETEKPANTVERHKDIKKPQPDETVTTAETAPEPVKAGWFTRLKNTLLPSRKKSESDDTENEAGLPAESTNNPVEEPEEPPKPGWLGRLKSTLLPSRKKSEPDDEEEVSGSTAKRTDKKAPEPRLKNSGGQVENELEEEEPEQPADKRGKKKWIALALLILLMGGGFGAWKWLLLPPNQKAPPATANKDAPAEAPEPKPADATALTEAAEKAQAEATALAEAAAKAQAEATAQAEAAAKAQAEAAAQAEATAQAKTEAPAAAADQAAAESPAAAAPVSANAEIQAQIEALRKQNLEMQAQIEALKKQRAPAAKPAGAAATAPKGGVLIINGKDTKESAQGLKKVIEEMNAASGNKNPQNPSR